MKGLLFLLAIFCTLQANAQPYSISFAGTGLSTVKVQNLTTGVIVDVPAGDVLLLSTPTGIPEVINMKSFGLKVYPNPMTDKSTLKIFPPVAGDAIITVYDMTGKVLTQFKGYLENYTQEFSLSGIKNGLHIINVRGNGYQFSEKLLSNGKSNRTAIIDMVSNNIQTVAEKKSIKDSKGFQATVDMAYNSGERLKYTAVSGNNSTVMTDIPIADNTVTFTFTECKDGDNNYYPVVQINTQLWMAENLAYLPVVHSNAEFITQGNNFQPGYGVYGYDGSDIATAKSQGNYTTYGVLYNWWAAMDGVCPTGWHLPSNGEWTTLENYLIANGYNYDGTTTGNKIAKSLASTTLWASSTNPGAVGNTDYPEKRNATGFTALPGGSRFTNGTFNFIGSHGYWWLATEADAASAWYCLLRFSDSYVSRAGFNKRYGFSVRCVRD